MDMELSFEHGLVEIIRTIEEETQRPVLVAVHGLPNSGKTHLIDQLVEYFGSKEMDAVYSEGYTSPKSIDEVKTQPEYKCDVFFFHMGWENHTPNDLVHLTVGIYNPELYSGLNGHYDLIIINPESKIKPFPKVLVQV